MTLIVFSQRIMTMTARHYTRTLTTSATPDQAYDALTTGFAAWWTQPDHAITRPGDRARFSFPPQHSYWTFEAQHLIPGERVELLCVDAFHVHDGQTDAIEQEWLGSRLIWTLRPVEAGCEIHFIHEGLQPDLHCWGVCEAGWDRFFVASLKAYLDTGKGMPHRASA